MADERIVGPGAGVPRGRRHLGQPLDHAHAQPLAAIGHRDFLAVSRANHRRAPPAAKAPQSAFMGSSCACALRIAFALTLAALAGAARAAMLGDASVPYRAHRTVTVDGRTYSGPVFHGPGHQRHEQDLLGMHEVFLLDTKAARGDLVLPALHTYVEFPFPPLMAELDSPDLLRHPVGSEAVAGIATTKYRVDHKAPDGSRADGFLWLTRSGMLMKLDVSVTRAHGGRPIRSRWNFRRWRSGRSIPRCSSCRRGSRSCRPTRWGRFWAASPAEEKRSRPSCEGRPVNCAWSLARRRG